MLGELQTKHCILLLVVLAICACVLSIFPSALAFSDDGSSAYNRRQAHELHKQMVKATLDWRTAKLHGLAQRIPVITVETRSDDAFLKMQGVQGQNGIAMCNVGVHGDWSSMVTKNEMILDWLDMQLEEHSDDLVIVVDAADTIFGGCDLEAMLLAYKHISAASDLAPVVISAGTGLFPTDAKYSPHRYGQLHKRREKVLAARKLPHNTSWRVGNLPWSKCALGNASNCTSPSYEFMNYGFMLGPVGALHRLISYVVRSVPPSYFDRVRAFFDPNKHTEELSDQGVASMYMFDHPDQVTLDYSMGMMASLHELPKDLLEVRKGRVWNRVTKQQQCFIHFNGDSKQYFGDVLERMKQEVPDYRDGDNLLK